MAQRSVIDVMLHDSDAAVMAHYMGLIGEYIRADLRQPQATVADALQARKAHAQGAANLAEGDDDGEESSSGAPPPQEDPHVARLLAEVAQLERLQQVLGGTSDESSTYAANIDVARITFFYFLHSMLSLQNLVSQPAWPDRLPEHGALDPAKVPPFFRKLAQLTDAYALYRFKGKQYLQYIRELYSLSMTGAPLWAQQLIKK